MQVAEVRSAIVGIIQAVHARRDDNIRQGLLQGVQRASGDQRDQGPGVGDDDRQLHHSAAAFAIASSNSAACSGRFGATIAGKGKPCRASSSSSSPKVAPVSSAMARQVTAPAE